MAGLSAAGYLTLALAGDLRARPAIHLACNILLFVLYAVSIRCLPEGDREDRRVLSMILAAALVFRVILLPSPPTLSDDIYRYIWEGRLQTRGINPYAHVPSDPLLAPYRDVVYDGINHKDLPAIYPPVMQWAMLLGASLGSGTTAMKSIFVSADVALILALVMLLRARGEPATHVLIYAWNPLAVIEIAGSGHNDSMAVLWLVVSTVAIIGERQVLSIAALGVSALGKLFPLFLLPLYAMRVRWTLLLMPPAMMAAAYTPYASAGENLLTSVIAYAERWRHNESIFGVLEAAVAASGISPWLKGVADALGLDSLYSQAHMLARALAAAIAMCVLGVLIRRLARGRLGLTRAIYLFTGTVLLLQPTLHPWYLVWILPWLVLYRSTAWLALTGLAAFSYLDAPWAVWVEYVPFYALLIGGWLQERRRQRDGVVQFPVPKGEQA